MNMNKTFFLRREDRKPQWIKIDAQGQVLGRLATAIATILSGKNKPSYTPHEDAGDYVVVVNAKDVVLTGKKFEQKTYDRYSGWIGGLKSETAEEIMQKDPTRIIELAVKRMLPKNKMSRALLRKLLIYADAEHPHKAQVA